jgi:hypothetical protein
MPPLLPKTPNLARDIGRERSLEEASPLNYRRPLTQATTFPASQKYSVRAGKEQSNPSVRAGKERSDAPASTQNNQLARASGREQSFEEASPLLTTHPS